MRGAFVDTCWTLVVRANGAETAEARRALDKLCRIYWYPLYCYVRRRGFTHADAEDLVQGFFATLLKRELFARADRQKGKLRLLLLATLQDHIADEWRKAGAAKRGGRVEFVPLDTTGAEERYLCEPADIASPDRLYDRRWALIFLQRVSDALGEEWKERDKGDSFAALSPHLFAPLEGEKTKALSERLGLNEDNVRKTLQRLRERYVALFRQEVAETVLTAADAAQEIAILRAALRGALS